MTLTLWTSASTTDMKELIKKCLRTAQPDSTRRGEHTAFPQGLTTESCEWRPHWHVQGAALQASRRMYTWTPGETQLTNSSGCADALCGKSQNSSRTQERASAQALRRRLTNMCEEVPAARGAAERHRHDTRASIRCAPIHAQHVEGKKKPKKSREFTTRSMWTGKEQEEHRQQQA